ncbi:cupin domain-containing protein [Chryseobacterium fluminis]|uniref:cupin domain-containing protein n=1 Tax=Chryseobacterium fluminis TaxID=2983606 RepID=UPI002259234D|nr:cupin domain-containing protein [Chryseobacterium sp. MMS21-Ot14]UZT96023.1 cupin domain-containing protein [Chryseobacterium sp. MMS21-Ot14]
MEQDVLPLQPTPAAVPWLWKWDELYQLAAMAGKLIELEDGGDRRALGLSNPGLNGKPYATETLWMALQWLNGKEIAPPHRHIAQASRFIIQSEGSYSTVEGNRIFLERGDFVLNPPLLWHDHGSINNNHAIWLDALDIPVTNYLNANFFESHYLDKQKVTKKINASVLKYGNGNYRPLWEDPINEYPPVSVYKWKETLKALNGLKEADEACPYDDLALEYVNSFNGNSSMKTFGASIQLIRPKIHTKAHRHVSSNVYYIFEGSGYSVIDGVRFNWSEGDFLVIPTWAYHEHCNTSESTDAILFSVSDRPLMQAMDKYRQEPLKENDGHQIVHSVFTGNL